MTGVILVVDDVPANVKLLEAKLTNEYYDVITAKDGFEAIEKTKTHKPDLILLDVMMPGMDGFETCRKIKEDAEVAHIPIVMVTALSEMSDRLQGLEAGADDFITKPINDTALFARVKSLVRIKVLIDELRLRDQSGAQMGIISEIVQGGLDVSGAHILLVDDDAVQTKRVCEVLGREHQVDVFVEHLAALEKAKQTPPDLIIISTMLMDIDGLRLATQFKAIDTVRNVPIVTLVDEDDTKLMLKALELGVNDYLVCPVDSSEMAARVRTQLRRKKYQDALKSNYKASVSMAITDGLTGLYNRHYLDTHLKNLTESSLQYGKNMSLVIMDMDHFKHVNDTYGHDVGDEVLKQLATIIVDATRSSDLVARFGGEEFVVLMPETDFQKAYDVSERIRASIERTPFKVSHEVGSISKTMSIGVASLHLGGDMPDAMLKRADTALYVAKNGGRNQVQPKKTDMETQSSAPAPLPMPQAPLPPTAPPFSPAIPISPQSPLHAQPIMPQAPLPPQAPPMMPPAMAPAPLPPAAQFAPIAPVAPIAAAPLQPMNMPLPSAPLPAAPTFAPIAPAAPAAAAPLQPMSMPLPPAPPIAMQPMSMPQPPAPPPSLAMQPMTIAPITPPAMTPMPMAPAPITPKPMAPTPEPPSRAAPPSGYNPHLFDDKAKVNTVGQGPNNVPIQAAQKAQIASKLIVTKNRNYRSPIDDEPEGTF